MAQAEESHLRVDNNFKAARMECGAAGAVREQIKDMQAARRPRVPQSGPKQQQLPCGVEAQALWPAAPPSCRTEDPLAQSCS